MKWMRSSREINIPDNWATQVEKTDVNFFLEIAVVQVSVYMVNIIIYN